MRYWINILCNIKSHESFTYFQVQVTHLLLCYFLLPLFHLTHICIREYSNDEWVLVLIPPPQLLVFLLHFYHAGFEDYCEMIAFKRWSVASKLDLKSSLREPKTNQKANQVNRWHPENETLLWIRVSLAWKDFPFGFQDKQRSRRFRRQINFLIC